MAALTPIREKLTQNAQPFLEPGEQVHHAFAAQSGLSPWLGGGALALAAIKHHGIIVTDRAIVVVRTGKMAAGDVKEVERRLPRSTQIGPVKGIWAKTNTLGEKMYIHKRFHKDVEAADAELAAGAGGQAPPPPPAAPAV